MEQKPLKICYVASEVEPFAKTGGLADVAGSLPAALKERNLDIRMMMPKYKSINDRKFVLREVIRLSEANVELGGVSRVASGKTAFLPNSKVHVYFLSFPEFFNRRSLYVDPETGKDFADNAERFAYFSKSVLETLKLLYWQPDIIHCNDWQTALIPYYLKTHYQDDPFFQGMRTLLTIHNVAFQGVFPLGIGKKIGIDASLLEKGQPFYFHGKLNFLKGGIHYADLLSTVSPTYAREICEDESIGAGLSDVLKARQTDLTGILNGADYNVWSPEKDRFIPHNYDLENLDKKIENKKALCEQFGLDFKAETPLLGLVTRLTEQKGMPLLLKAMNGLLKEKIQLVILGVGDPEIQQKLKELAAKNSSRMAFQARFDNRTAHLIEAGSDILLMPSRFEPCGLNQIYSLRYGTIPLVHQTGGLADTVIDVQTSPEKGNGFVFKEFTPAMFLKTVEAAIATFRDTDKWREIQRRAVTAVFSWEKSAREYAKLYEKVAAGR